MKPCTEQAMPRKRAKHEDGPWGEILITLMIVVLVLLTLPR